MTKTVEEVRRAAFELWSSSKWPSLHTYRRDALPHDHPKYGEYVHLEHEWQAFNAALDSVEIQLPSERDLDHDRKGVLAVGYCRSAIEQTGLGLRVK